MQCSLPTLIWQKAKVLHPAQDSVMVAALIYNDKLIICCNQQKVPTTLEVYVELRTPNGMVMIL
jgi:hypothetical protein